MKKFKFWLIVVAYILGGLYLQLLLFGFTWQNVIEYVLIYLIAYFVLLFLNETYKKIR